MNKIPKTDTIIVLPNGKEMIQRTLDLSSLVKNKIKPNKMELPRTPQELSILLTSAAEEGAKKALSAFNNPQPTKLSDELIPSSQIPALLGIHKNTWQQWRDKRVIPFSQFGSKIYVKRSDLEAFLNNHIVK